VTLKRFRVRHAGPARLAQTRTVNGPPDEDVAWALVEEARTYLTISELNSVFVRLGVGDFPAAIETMLRAVASSKASLSSVLEPDWATGPTGTRAIPPNLDCGNIFPASSHTLASRRRHLKRSPGVKLMISRRRRRRPR
jgi:hypothetical protein